MPSQDYNVQWYPGHMAKTRRLMAQNLKLVDAVCELRDARIPESSRNPDLDEICGDKPRMILLNRADLADPKQTRLWKTHLKAQGFVVVETDCKSKKGVAEVAPAVRVLLRDKLERYAAKGQSGRMLRVMVVGIPNVGKSTFINQISGRKGAAKAENRPGVTRGTQWVTVDKGLELLDTPGILWPRFDDPEVGRRLAYTGAVKDAILDTETLAAGLMELLNARYPEALAQRYKLDAQAGADGLELLESAGRKRGFLVSGGEVDLQRAAQTVLEEFRSGKLGRLTLEGPMEQEAAK